MRGQAHTKEVRERLSTVKRSQYAAGTVQFRRYKLSQAEREIGRYLRDNGHKVLAQYHIPGVPYLYDFFLPEHNLLIEYQGDYWHANPSKYPPGTILPIQGKGPVPVEEIWARDADKKAQAEDRGFRVLWVWESDFKAKGLQGIQWV